MVQNVKTQSFQFNALTVLDGLSQHDVSSILQDSEGFMWFGTYDGLNRFDGYEIERFYHRNNDETTLSSNRIQSLLEDKQKRIWIGTDGYGLNIYHLTDGSMERVTVPQNFEIINDIKQNDRGNILIASDKGLLQVSEKENAFQVEVLQTPLTGLNIKQIEVLTDGTILFATNRGLWTYQNNSYSVVKGSSDLRFNTVIETKKSVVWAGGPDGLYKVNNGVFLKEEKVVANILSLSEGIKDDLWISTFGKGIFHYDFKGAAVEKVTAELKEHEYAINNNPIKKVFIDNSQTLWISNRNGLLSTNLRSKKFNTLSLARKGHVRTLFAYGDQVYYGYQADKFYVHNSRTGINKPITLGQEVKPFKVDTLGGVLHLATTRGLYRQKYPNTEKFDLVDVFDDASMNKSIIYTSFVEDRFGNQYLGTFKGLVFKGKSKTEFIHNISQNFEALRNIRVFSLKVDYRKNCIWVGTISNGLFKINLNSVGEIRSLENYNEQLSGSYQIPNNSIWSFFQDNIGNLFVGTDTGLLVKQPEEEQFTTVENDVILNKKIMAIISDDDSNLWLTNSQGIIKYNLKTNLAVNYNNNDGLLTNTFTEAISQNENRELFFGSIQGINFINPKELKVNPFPSKIALTNLFVKNNKVNVNEKIEGSVVLTSRLNTAQNLTFDHKQNDFTIGFSSTNYANTTVNRYRYKLKNHDKDWQLATNDKRFARYSRIPSGTYTFMVEATNPNGEWSGLPRNIEIKVLPAPWNSWWAYSAYFLVIASITYTIISFWLNKQKLRNQIQLSRLKNQQEKEINEMKLTFFTDVAHEFKTPLSLIVGPIDDLIKGKASDEHREFCYNILSRNTNRMMNLTNQLLDFRKISSGINILQVSRNDLCLFVNEVTKSFEWQAKSNDIKLKVIAPKSYVCHFDKDILEKVIYNLLSNAFKYTPYGGTIEIELKPTWKQDLEYFIIQIKDSGKGISQADKRRIFERYFHGKNRSSSGIGLHLTAKLIEAHKGEINVLNSSLGGTEFMITLPVSSKAFSEDEFLTKDDMPLVIPENFEPGEIPETKEEIDENGKEKILIVEDDYDLRKYLRNILLTDYVVIEATNGKQGLEACLKELPDMVISDVMMPELDGVEMCKMIKSNILISHIPILLLTAKTGDKYHAEGLKVGAWDYIAKPFNTSQLLQKVKNISETRNRYRDYISSGETEKTSKLYVSFDQQFVHKATEIVKSRMADTSFSVEVLSNELGLSRMQLHRKLKTLIGSNTTAFINSIRIKLAIQMFDEGCDRVQEAMDAVGINSYAHFITLFKKEKKMTPKKYIERKKELNESIN